MKHFICWWFQNVFNSYIFKLIIVTEEPPTTKILVRIWRDNVRTGISKLKQNVLRAHRLSSSAFDTDKGCKDISYTSVGMLQLWVWRAQRTLRFTNNNALFLYRINQSPALGLQHCHMRWHLYKHKCSNWNSAHKI